VFQSHGDQVTAVPNGADALAGSDTAPVEMWSLGEDVLAWQAGAYTRPRFGSP